MRTAATLVVLALGTGSACAGSAAGSSAPGRLRIVTTVAPITSIVAAVVGDRADVVGLVPEGTNSHTFEPRPSAAAALARADVVFVNGLDLEDPTVDLARANLRRGAEVVELGRRAIPRASWIFDFSFPRSGGRPNPHLWTDPPLAARYARLVADVVVRRDPSDRDVFERNLRRFTDRAGQLSAAMRTATRTVPNPALLTYHDAYAYLARDFGWKVIGAVQPSSFEEPTPRDVVHLIGQIRAERVPAIFGSEVFPSPVLAQIGRETGVRYVDVLRDDDLPGRPGDLAHSWVGLMRADLVAMIEHLGGDARALRAVPLGGLAPDQARYPQ